MSEEEKVKVLVLRSFRANKKHCHRGTRVELKKSDAMNLQSMSNPKARIVTEDNKDEIAKIEKQIKGEEKGKDDERAERDKRAKAKADAVAGK